MSSSPKRAKATTTLDGSQMDLLADRVAGMLAHMARSPVAALSTEVRELCRVSIFDGIFPDARGELLQLADACGPELERCIGCMQGMAVADSLGHLWEFQVRAAAVAVGGVNTVGVAVLTSEGRMDSSPRRTLGGYTVRLAREWQRLGLIVEPSSLALFQDSHSLVHHVPLSALPTRVPSHMMFTACSPSTFRASPLSLAGC